jgi:hypothetical protein
MVTSKELGFYLVRELKKEGLNVIFYNGSDSKSEQVVNREKGDSLPMY